jgi:hypothetical protein
MTSAQPPPYSTDVVTSKQPHRSILDLRAQIIANASAVNPKKDVHKAADDHLDVVIAKEPVTGVSRSAISSTPAKHYAILIERRRHSNEPRILAKGEAKDSVEEALEWMLEKTEIQTHSLALRMKSTSDDCSVM